MKHYLAVVMCLAILLSTSCASNPKKIGAAYVSPLKYKDYDCDQIALEMDHISRRTTELYHSLKADNTADKWQMGVGLIVFWPALFLLEGGDGPEAAEYAQLKGEYEALRQVAVEKKCQLSSLPPSPEEIIKESEEQRKKEDKDAEEGDSPDAAASDAA